MIKNDLCISCGVCEAVCPKNCISFQKNNFNFVPQISDNCIKCGLCKKVCPMQNLCDNFNSDLSIEKAILGNYKKILSAKSKNKTILQNATSGGAITTLIKALLNSDVFDAAFLLDGYSYNNLLSTKLFQKNDDLSKTQKSRYLTVSHYNTCKYISGNPDKKIIIVGTGCCINAILNFIKLKNLKRENYLFLGLICDKTMNYGVVEYFRAFSKNKNLLNLFFRTKINGGWPGNIRLEYSDGSFLDLDKKERMKVKNYFLPECCLYCLNKLNTNADMVFGDNYIKELEDIEGKSSVLIRTDLGISVFEKFEHLFEFLPTDEKTLLYSLKLGNRNKHLAFAKIKGFIKGNIDECFYSEYKNALSKIKIGSAKNVYKAVQKDLNRNPNIFEKIKQILKLRI